MCFHAAGFDLGIRCALQLQENETFLPVPQFLIAHIVQARCDRSRRNVLVKRRRYASVSRNVQG